MIINKKEIKNIFNYIIYFTKLYPGERSDRRRRREVIAAGIMLSRLYFVLSLITYK